MTTRPPLARNTFKADPEDQKLLTPNELLMSMFNLGQNTYAQDASSWEQGELDGDGAEGLAKSLVLGRNSGEQKVFQPAAKPRNSLAAQNPTLANALSTLRNGSNTSPSPRASPIQRSSPPARVSVSSSSTTTALLEALSRKPSPPLASSAATRLSTPASGQQTSCSYSTPTLADALASTPSRKNASSPVVEGLSGKGGESKQHFVEGTKPFATPSSIAEALTPSTLAQALLRPANSKSNLSQANIMNILNSVNSTVAIDPVTRVVRQAGPVTLETPNNGAPYIPTTTAGSHLVSFNGHKTEVPDEIRCHLCNFQMKLCYRKSKYKDEIREYPAYRCLRKGCQTFRAIRKVIEPDSYPTVAPKRKISFDDALREMFAQENIFSFEPSAKVSKSASSAPLSSANCNVEKMHGTLIFVPAPMSADQVLKMQQAAFDILLGTAVERDKTYVAPLISPSPLNGDQLKSALRTSEGRKTIENILLSGRQEPLTLTISTDADNETETSSHTTEEMSPSSSDEMVDVNSNMNGSQQSEIGQNVLCNAQKAASNP